MTQLGEPARGDYVSSTPKLASIWYHSTQYRQCLGQCLQIRLIVPPNLVSQAVETSAIASCSVFFRKPRGLAYHIEAQLSLSHALHAGQQLSLHLGVVGGAEHFYRDVG
ncbi:hypothetical protein SCAR479_06321 [Seiridium cardinale]|uniref:Uncharacterized protein n=1 Tax=Seiridium cardinale TaxID=138064 RepID=A0ABR2XTK9_9PEZI